MKTGITNTLEVVALFSSLGVAFNGAKADGTINAADLGQLINIVPTIGPAIEGIGEIPAELKDLEPAEIETLKNRVISVVGQISGEKATRITSKSLTAGLAILDLILEIRSDDAAQDTPAADVVGADEEESE